MDAGAAAMLAILIGVFVFSIILGWYDAIAHNLAAGVQIIKRWVAKKDDKNDE